MQGGNPDMMMRMMMKINPQFRQFVEQNRGKTPEQIAQEHGISLDEFNMLR